MCYHVRLDDRRVFGNNMKIIITKGYEELSAKALEIMKGVVKSNPYAVLGLATGTTPLGLYSHMIEDHKSHGTSYAHIRTVNLDEYKELPKDHPLCELYGRTNESRANRGAEESGDAWRVRRAAIARTPVETGQG